LLRLKPYILVVYGRLLGRDGRNGIEASRRIWCKNRYWKIERTYGNTTRI
jgi:hypothetical protein